MRLVLRGAAVIAFLCGSVLPARAWWCRGYYTTSGAGAPATVYHAPASNAAPVYHAPTYYAAPVYHAAAYYAAPVYYAPTYVTAAAPVTYAAAPPAAPPAAPAAGCTGGAAGGPYAPAAHYALQTSAAPFLYSVPVTTLPYYTYTPVTSYAPSPGTPGHGCNGGGSGGYGNIDTGLKNIADSLGSIKDTLGRIERLIAAKSEKPKQEPQKQGPQKAPEIEKKDKPKGANRPSSNPPLTSEQVNVIVRKWNTNASKEEAQAIVRKWERGLRKAEVVVGSHRGHRPHLPTIPEK